jgi:hypothetical protein
MMLIHSSFGFRARNALRMRTAPIMQIAYRGTLAQRASVKKLPTSAIPAAR